MNNLDPEQGEKIISLLVDHVRAGAGYRSIHPDVVRRLAASELQKGRNYKETLKAVRNKLHQVGGAYFDHAMDYSQLSQELDQLSYDPTDIGLRDYCLRVMHLHASTRERLPILERFFAQALESIAPVSSVLDLACGLNPLAIPWMPLAQEISYYACDIYTDMLEYLNHFFLHLSIQGKAIPCDLQGEFSGQPPVQLALLLKSLPCLEQLDKHIGRRLLGSIPAEYILVSFPGHSLGGKSKGMFKNYTRHFDELIGAGNWQVRPFEFSNELAFLIHHEK